MLPSHGKLSCRKCFPSTDEAIAEPHPDWKIVNDPGSWGSSCPKHLVLGFSKGSTQAGIYKNGRFEDIAYAGMRSRLTSALRIVGILNQDETVDEKISDPESNISFASLIRCSVSRLDKKASEKHGREIYACTGPLITKSFLEIPNVLKTCAETYLSDLPDSLEIIFLLGNTDSYVQSCQTLVEKLYPNDFERINAMAVKAGGRVWIHLAHPSGLNGHFNTWLNSDSGSGLKRKMSQDAISYA